MRSMNNDSARKGSIVCQRIIVLGQEVQLA